MFERFTDRARKVMGWARQVALRLHHGYIGTEHLLLGLLREGGSVATWALENLDFDLEELRCEVESLVHPGTTTVTKGQIPFTPGARETLELTVEGAVSLGHGHIGTEHLLLALIQQAKGIAALALRNLHVDLDDVRGEVLVILGAKRSALPEAREDPVITLHTRRACRRAYAVASARGRLVKPTDLLLGLLDLGDPDIDGLLARWGADLEGLRKDVADRLDGRPPPSEPGGPAR